MKKTQARRAIENMYNPEKLSKSQIRRLTIQFAKSSLDYTLRKKGVQVSVNPVRALSRRVVRDSFPKKVSAHEATPDTAKG